MVDDPQKRYVASALLRSDGYEVVTSAGHEGVLDLFSQSLSLPSAWVSFVAAYKPDVVMVDLELPSGIALITIGALAKHPLTTHIPVVAMGHELKRAEMKTATSIGAASTFCWPAGLEGLGPHIEDALDRF